MKYLLYLFIFYNSCLFAQNINLNEVRLLFQKSVSDEVTCKKLVTDLSAYNEFYNTTFAAYKACATMMMANHCLNPFKKLSYFNEGKLLLEKCINYQSDNIELRYLRFTVQSSSPNFLGYNKSIQEDKYFLLRHYSALDDQQLKNMIGTYLQLSEYLTSSEKHIVKS